MHVLAIGSDPHFFEQGSEVRTRMRTYASQFDSLHIIAHAPRYTLPVRDGAQLHLWPARGWMSIIGTSLSVARRHQIDVIDAQDAAEFGLAAWMVARWTRKPLRIQVHTDIMSPWYRRASWKEHIRYWIALFLLPRATCIRVVSERIKRSLVARGKEREARISVLPIRTNVNKFLNAHEDPVITTRFTGHSVKMVAVGRFVDKEKNFSMLIHCMHEIVKKMPDALLVLVGDGPDKVNFQFLISNFQLQRNVILEPWRDDLHIFYKSFNIFVSSSNYEGWGRAVIEAMASGLPVVMTDVGHAGEVVHNGENGIVVSVQDEDALTTALLSLAQNKKERERLARAGQETVQKLQITEEEYLRRYKAALTSCLTK